ncbi:MAG: DNA mismatch repair endonuclease MutL [Peptococcaceae bacterium]
MGIIQVLEDRVANQIAAGEVIERPSSAVKELIENALDANAKNITIEIENGGVDLIKITDDGDGFYEDDLPLAIKRHATSKIVDFNDVYRLNTFGFRGEALASIAVISRLRITSGRADDTPSKVLTTDANGSVDIAVAAPRKGTCIEVKDLYYNVPARKKFVKSNSHESALIYDLVCKFALGFPEISFTYLNNHEVIFSSNQLTQTTQILQYIYGDIDENDIIHFQNDAFYQKQTIEGWFFPPTVTRKNRNHMVYFVNNRLIESKELNQIIDEAVDTLIPKGRFCICVLKLQLPAFNIDVNVHPSKKIIKFKNIDDWKNDLIQLIKEELWLSKLNVPYEVKPDTEPLTLKQQTVTTPVIPQTLDFSSSVTEASAAASQELSLPLCRHTIEEVDNTAHHEVPSFQEHLEVSSVVAETPSDYTAMSQSPAQSLNPNLETMTNEETPASAEKAATALSQKALLELDYIGQLNKTFILAQDTDNLYIIDQHTLHERILYEKYMKEYNTRHIVQQPLLHPVSLNVTPLQEDTLIKNILVLRQLGFTLKTKGPLSYEIETVPSILSGNTDSFADLLLDLLDDLHGKDTLRGLADINEERIITAACKAAVKAHYQLTKSEVRYLLKELSTLDNAHTCPHGRPIIMNISMNDIYLFFKRGSY